MATVKLYKTIFRFNLLCASNILWCYKLLSFGDISFKFCIDQRKLITPLSIEFIRMELRLQYVCIPMYCDIFASAVLFTETTKSFELMLP